MLDYQYVAGWSLARDLEILLATVPPCSRAAARTDHPVRILHVTEASWAGTLQVVREARERPGGPGTRRHVRVRHRPELPEGIAGAVARGVELVPSAGSASVARHADHRGPGAAPARPGPPPELVHLHSSFAGAVGALALPRGTPLIYSPHGFAFAAQDRPTAAAVHPVEAFVARRCALLGAVSEAEAELARDGLRAPPGRGRPQRHPRARPRRAGTSARPGRAVVVGLGRIAERAAGRERADPVRARARAPRRLDRRLGRGDDDVAVREAGIPVTGWLPRDEALERARARRPSTSTGRPGTGSRSRSSRRSRATSSSSPPTSPPTARSSAPGRCARTRLRRSRSPGRSWATPELRARTARRAAPPRGRVRRRRACARSGSRSTNDAGAGRGASHAKRDVRIRGS